MPEILGHTISKKPFIAGLIIASGVTGYILYKRHQAGGTSTADASAYGYGAYGYGAYGYGMGIAAYGYGGYGYGAYGYGGYGYGGFVPSVGSITPPVAPTPSSNAEWATAAEATLSNEGFNPTSVAAALGKYLLAGTLTSDQTSIVQAAIAAQNYPPVAGPNNYPPNMHTSPAGGQGGGGGGKTGKESGKRHVAAGATSLNTWAKNHKTTSGEIIGTTDKNFESGFMTAMNHSKFDKYLNKGTTAKMPAGLVFFSTK